MAIRVREEAASHVALVASGVVIGGGLLMIAAMALAAIAFANAVTTAIPFVVTLQGGRDADGSPYMVIDGSLVGAFTATVLFAFVWWAVSARHRLAEVNRELGAGLGPASTRGSLSSRE